MVNLGMIIIRMVNIITDFLWPYSVVSAKPILGHLIPTTSCEEKLLFLNCNHQGTEAQ